MAFSRLSLPTTLLLVSLVTIWEPAQSAEYCSAADSSTEGCTDKHTAWTDEASTCNRLDLGADSFVCACSGTQCDFLGRVSHATDADTFRVVTSTRDRDRFAVTDGLLSSTSEESSTIVRLNPDIQYQSMIGFGGAFTDSTGISILSLSYESQDILIKSYFAPEGIGYNLGRIPIGGSDFSTKPYAYDAVEGDVQLEHFALTQEDLEYKIPIIHRAKAAMADPSSLLSLTSPWSPPAWMKTNNKIHGSGSVKKELWQTYSNYIVKFLDAYEKAGVPVWCLATQNEPLCSLTEEWKFNTCLWRTEDMREWISTSLGPTLHASGYGHVKMIISDQVRHYLTEYVEGILLDQTASEYVSGIGVHWYTDQDTGVDVLTKTHARFPDKFLLYTEACTGYDSPPDKRVILGDWSRAEQYAASIIESSTHYSTGWVDWNMALNMQGGPNWAGNFVDSPIIVDQDKDTFYKQPMFYAMGHFSKFVERGSKVIYTSLMANSSVSSDLSVAVYVTEDKRAVAVLLNTAEEEKSVSVYLGSSTDKYIHLQMPAKSMQTVLFTLK